MVEVLCLTLLFDWSRNHETTAQNPQGGLQDESGGLENKMPIATIDGVRLNYTIHGEGEWLVLIGGYASGNWQAESWFP